MEISKDCIYITSDELYKMKPFRKDGNHIESKLYINEGLVYKVFNDYNKDFKLMKKKEAKIEILKKIKTEDLIIPKYKLYINGYFAGHCTEEFMDCLELDECFCKQIPRKVELLTKTSEILKRLHDRKIIVGDLNYGNVLFSGNEVKYCDVDSFIINNIVSNTHFELLDNIKISPCLINTLESDIFLINFIVLDLLINYDVNEMVVFKKEKYFNDIKDLSLPKRIENVFLNLFNMLDGSEDIVYPHFYLDELGHHLIKRKELR